MYFCLPPRELTPEVPYLPSPKTSGSSPAASSMSPAPLFAESTQMKFCLVCFAEDDPPCMLTVMLPIFIRALYFLLMLAILSLYSLLLSSQPHSSASAFRSLTSASSWATTEGVVAMESRVSRAKLVNAPTDPEQKVTVSPRAKPRIARRSALLRQYDATHSAPQLFQSMASSRRTRPGEYEGRPSTAQDPRRRDVEMACDSPR